MAKIIKITTILKDPNYEPKSLWDILKERKRASLTCDRARRERERKKSSKWEQNRGDIY